MGGLRLRQGVARDLMAAAPHNIHICGADIYCRTISGQYIGLSVKQDVLCTKTNFSVEKIIGELEPSNELSTIRRKVLSKHGFMKHDPTKRSEVNALFYPNQENEYWDSIRKYIQLYEKESFTLNYI